MDRAIRRHDARPVLSVVVVTLVSAGSLSLGMPASTAVANMCRARNVTQDSSSDSNLQAVIRAATKNDVIAVRFVCVGNFRIAKNLTLIGRPTAGLPYGVLNANGHGQVLVVPRAKVTLKNLKITGGAVSRWHLGAGITTAARLLRLKDTVVDGNTGTGIYNTGTLTLNGSSTISHNSEAGIDQDGYVAPIGASLTMNGTSTITGNSGFGIYSYYAHTTLNDSSSVSGNVTDVLDAVYNWEGTLTLNDAASVANNIGNNAAIWNAATSHDERLFLRERERHRDLAGRRHLQRKHGQYHHERLVISHGQLERSLWRWDWIRWCRHDERVVLDHGQHSRRR